MGSKFQSTEESILNTVAPSPADLWKMVARINACRYFVIKTCIDPDMENHKSVIDMLMKSDKEMPTNPRELFQSIENDILEGIQEKRTDKLR